MSIPYRVHDSAYVALQNNIVCCHLKKYINIDI
jgi:hypothetical protein